jgi:beta-galactosidase
MIYDFDSRHAFQNQPCSPQFSYSAHFQTYYRALASMGMAIDIIPANADILTYALVVAPTLYVIKPEVADKLIKYVEDGGNLITTFRSGVKDEFSRIVDMPLPGLLKDVCGVTVDEYGVVLNGEENRIKLINSKSELMSVWIDILNPNTAEVLARYEANYAEGKPAVTCNVFGKGKAVYAGTWLSEDTISAIVKTLMPVED